MLTTQTSSAPSSSLEGAGRIGVPAVLDQIGAVERFVAVAGPPAAGKSTVTRALADRSGAQVFRLREFAHEFRSRPTIDQRPFDTRDSLGWFPEETVFLLLQTAFIQRQFPAVVWWCWRTSREASPSSCCSRRPQTSFGHR
ncbi:MAG: hypothetical protein ACRDUV_24900 [Pseudonocardiaceae bacterium]